MKFIHMDNLTDQDRKSIWEDSKGEVNVVVLTKELMHADLETMFGPWEENDFTVFVDEGVQWHKVMVALGCFTSNSDAQRAGWRKDIEDGFTDRFQVAKPPRRRVIWSLKMTIKPESGIWFHRIDVELLDDEKRTNPN